MVDDGDREFRDPPARRRPGRPARTDRSRVIDAALELVATTGLDGFTMSHAALAVGLSEMGLYRYVAGRDELIELVVDAALQRIVPDDIALPPRPADVRQVLVDLGHRLVRGMAGYPGVAAHLAVHGPSRPSGLRLMGDILRLLTHAHVPADAVTHAHGHYTSTICSVATFRQHVAAPDATTWGATADERLADVEWAGDPALSGIATRFTGDVSAYEQYAISHCVDAVLADARPPRRR